MTYYITCLNIVCILFKKKTKRTYVENNEKIALEKKYGWETWSKWI